MEPHPLQSPLCRGIWIRAVVSTTPDRSVSTSQDTHTTFPHTLTTGGNIESAIIHMCMFLDCVGKKPTWTKRKQTLIHTLSITVEELVNPISPLFACLLLPPYALLMDHDSSMRCFIAKIIFVWEFQMWTQPCRLTAGTGLDL